MGKITPEKFDQAERVETELNYLLTEEMTEYRDELEQMLLITSWQDQRLKGIL